MYTCTHNDEGTVSTHPRLFSAENSKATGNDKKTNSSLKSGVTRIYEYVMLM